MSVLLGRYSHTGFSACYQSFIKERMDYTLSFDKAACGFSGHLADAIENSYLRDQKAVDLQFPLWAVHAFLLPVDEEDVRFFLNHLPASHGLPYHETSMNDDTPAYGDWGSSIIFTTPVKTLGELKRDGWTTVYIPLEQPC